MHEAMTNVFMILEKQKVKGCTGGWKIWGEMKTPPCSHRTQKSAWLTTLNVWFLRCILWKLWSDDASVEKRANMNLSFIPKHWLGLSLPYCVSHGRVWLQSFVFLSYKENRLQLWTECLCLPLNFSVENITVNIWYLEVRSLGDIWFKWCHVLVSLEEKEEWLESPPLLSNPPPISSSPLPHLPVWEHTRKVTIFNPERRQSSKETIDQHPDLRPMVSKTIRNKFLLFILHL